MVTATTEPSSGDLFAERRVRAAELALEAARRRVADAEEEIVRLRGQVEGLEQRVVEAAGRAGAEPARLRAELEAEVRVRRMLEQALAAERARAGELEEELGAALDRGTGAEAERRVAAAERRAGELEAELELVRRRASEFEQQTRLSIEEAWRWMGEASDRVAAALAELEDVRRASVAAPATSPPQARVTSAPAAAPESEPVRPERFDEALRRLRAQVAAEPEPPA